MKSNFIKIDRYLINLNLVSYILERDAHHVRVCFIDGDDSIDIKITLAEFEKLIK